jgi:RimJ/RimL family protein N-acetyltransferase
VARPYDAAALLELKHQLDRETAFMMYEPDERDSPVRDLAAELARLGRSANSVILLAELTDQLIGYVQLTGGSLRRSRATAYVVIGVLAHASGRGTGTGLLRQVKAWAAARGLHRLELTVMAHNIRAIRLYERMGFSVEGRRSECLLIDGQFIDELTMALLLPPAPATPLSLTPLPPYPSPRYPLSPSRHLRSHPSPATSARPRPPFGVCVPQATFLRGLCATEHVTEARTAPLPHHTSHRPHTAPARLARGPHGIRWLASALAV